MSGTAGGHAIPQAVLCCCAAATQQCVALNCSNPNEELEDDLMDIDTAATTPGLPLVAHPLAGMWGSCQGACESHG
jgi:hypothetical protein